MAEEGSLAEAEVVDTKEREDSTSGTMPDEGPVEHGGRTRTQTRTEHSRRTEGCKPTRRMIDETKAGQDIIIARDGGKRDLPEETCKGIKVLSKTDEATKSAEKVERNSGR